MEYLPFILGGVGILILGLVGVVYLQNERLKQRLVGQAIELLRQGGSPEGAQLQLNAPDLSAEQAVQVIRLAQHKLRIEEADQKLQQGATEDQVRNDFISRGVGAEAADEALGAAAFHRFCRERPGLSMGLGIVLPLVGLGLMVAGLLLWLGNKSGRFVPFPFSGHIVLGIGLMVTYFGGRLLVRTLSL